MNFEAGRIIRNREVGRLTGLGRTTRWRREWERSGKGKLHKWPAWDRSGLIDAPKDEVKP